MRLRFLAVKKQCLYSKVAHLFTFSLFMLCFSRDNKGPSVWIYSWKTKINGLEKQKVVDGTHFWHACKLISFMFGKNQFSWPFALNNISISGDCWGHFLKILSHAEPKAESFSTTSIFYRIFVLQKFSYRKAKMSFYPNESFNFSLLGLTGCDIKNRQVSSDRILVRWRSEKN